MSTEEDEIEEDEIEEDEIEEDEIEEDEIEKVCAVKPLIILDLDETLVHSTREKNKKLEYLKLTIFVDFRTIYHVYKRPFVDEFLDFCFEHFDVSVWTASSSAYAKEIVSLLFADRKLQFVHTANKCISRTCRDGLFHSFSEVKFIKIKDLKKVFRGCRRYPKDRVLIIDDTATTFQRNYGNAIQVHEWNAKDDRDEELLDLILYLQRLLAITTSWRKIEKRYWHPPPTQT
jgi:RNA polymerase II subunit A small phosphatase-like protein